MRVGREEGTEMQEKKEIKPKSRRRREKKYGSRTGSTSYNK
jgi:hypothetical protein